MAAWDGNAGRLTIENESGDGDWATPTYDAAGNVTPGPKPADESTGNGHAYDPDVHQKNRLAAVKQVTAPNGPCMEISHETADGS